MNHEHAYSQVHRVALWQSSGYRRVFLTTSRLLKQEPVIPDPAVNSAPMFSIATASDVGDDTTRSSTTRGSRPNSGQRATFKSGQGQSLRLAAKHNPYRSRLGTRSPQQPSRSSLPRAPLYEP